MSRQRIDLNLFRVFDAVMQHRSVSGASAELGVTSSAVSHALSRLRQALGDELFISGETGMEPTSRALELAPGIRDGLAQIDDVVVARPFVPSETVRTFRIAATDYAAVTILPHLIGRMAQAASQSDLRIFPFSRMDVVRQLDDGRIDLIVGWFGDLPDRMRRSTIIVDKEAVVVRPGHPLTEGPVTRERLFAFPFLVVELTGTEEQATDGFLDDRGVSRRVWIDRLLIETDDENLVGRVAVSVPHYAAVPPMLRATDMIATLPHRLALPAVEQGALVMLDLPYEPLAVAVEVVRHQRADRDAGLHWLTMELIDVMRGVS